MEEGSHNVGAQLNHSGSQFFQMLLFRYRPRVCSRESHQSVQM